MSTHLILVRCFAADDASLSPFYDTFGTTRCPHMHCCYEYVVTDLQTLPCMLDRF
nr:MAG TPA: hypothetical protein [Caudoviricetes sp.]